MFLEKIVQIFLDRITELHIKVTSLEAVRSKEETDYAKALQELKDHRERLDAEFKKKEEDQIIASQKIFDEANQYKADAEKFRTAFEDLRALCAGKPPSEEPEVEEVEEEEVVEKAVKKKKK